MKVKVNNKALADTLGVKVDSVVNVETKNGVPTNREWRNRLADAKIDNCVSVIGNEKISKSTKGGK